MSIRARFRLAREEFALDVDLDLPGRGVTALFGPSGSGKTSLLRLIAGLDHAPGYLEVNGEVWQDDAKRLLQPTHQRALGYVFQEASLFPHLSARRNLEYGMQRVAPGLRRVDRAHILDLLGIGHLLERKPHQLSGGERQRIAIGRALLTSPRILLMDEPLSALDTARKQEILPYLERLHGELDIPVLYVSHAPDEVARLADHIVVMCEGRAVASGPLSATLARLDLPIHLGEDAGVVLDAVVTERDAQWQLARATFAEDLAACRTLGSDCENRPRRDQFSTISPGNSRTIAQEMGEKWAGAAGLQPEIPKPDRLPGVWVRDGGHAIGQAVRVRILARDISLALTRHNGTSIQNILPGVVMELGSDTHPALALVKINVGGAALVARLTRRSAHDLNLTPGQLVYAQIKAVALIG